MPLSTPRRILLLASLFNSLTQAVYTRLLDRGYTVAVAYAVTEEQMIAEVEAFAPDWILAPYLKKRIPEAIYDQYPTFVFHPGPRGDRGAYSLDHALARRVEQWGVVILRANALYDGGDLYAVQTFPLRPHTTKASPYRREVVQAALEALDTLLDPHRPPPIPQDLRPLHSTYTQSMRAIDWAHDRSETIVAKVALSDSHPGVLDTILGVECHLYGAWIETRLKGEPKTILAKRDGAICLGTVDGAVWISHLKEPHRFKLPATYVLKDRLKGIKEDRLPLIFDRSYRTFHEVYAHQRDGVGYLHFNFHNGAMGTAQCYRLKYAFESLAETCDTVVLMGGEDFFSNGIHLNLLEESKKQGEEGWENINAMNDLVRSILQCETAITVASLHRNAGAGGVFLALACDVVVAREGVVLNPHYRTLGLSGSEYHTWTLPRRVGKARAQALLEACLPLSAEAAASIGMVDHLLPAQGYKEALHQWVHPLYSEERLWDKQDAIEAERPEMEAAREAEIRVMHPEFWDPQSPFHRLRQAFVYQTCPTHTPERLRQPKESPYA